MKVQSPKIGVFTAENGAAHHQNGVMEHAAKGRKMKCRTRRICSRPDSLKSILEATIQDQRVRSQMKPAKEAQAVVIALRNQEIQDLGLTIGEKNKAIGDLKSVAPAHFKEITIVQEKHQAEKSEELELLKQSALEWVKRHEENTETINRLTHELDEKDAINESLRVQTGQPHSKTLEDLQHELGEKRTIIETLVAQQDSTKAITERRGAEFLTRIQHLGSEVKAKDGRTDEVERQRDEFQHAADTRMADLTAAQANIQNLVDDYDNLVQRSKVREQELNDKIKTLEASNGRVNAASQVGFVPHPRYPRSHNTDYSPLPRPAPAG